MRRLVRRVRNSVRPGQRFRDRRARRLVAQMAGPKLLRAFAARFPTATFVEIGANDGDQQDHLRSLITSHEWRGVMVEPVPYVFERLRTNYGSLKRVALENAAIADQNGRLPFYYLAASQDREREGLPRWYDGIGSFSREQVVDHRRLIPDIEDRLVQDSVPCLTFGALCAKHGLASVDLLVIDTEGFDYEILRHIDLDVHRPVLIVYEHYHLNPADRRACLTRMHEAGYETMPEGFDTWCLRPDADPDLARVWRRLRPVFPELGVEDEPR